MRACSRARADDIFSTLDESFLNNNQTHTLLLLVNMVFVQRVFGLNGGRLFSLGLLMLTAVHHVPLTTGQQGVSYSIIIAINNMTNYYSQFQLFLVGVSLKLHGVAIPNNSLVDLDDILYRAPNPCCNITPSNSRPELHDGALLCVTDLEDCCDAPHTVQGDWYHPNGSIVPSGDPNDFGPAFLSNRGPHEVNDCRQFYGSVRLFRRWSSPPERGRFRCEIPSAADPNVTQILYANIGEL